MKLICITGIDGAGKTTLASSIVTALRKEGCNAIYVYGRIYPVISRLLMFLGRQIWLHATDLQADYEAYTSSKKNAMLNPFLATAYTAAVWTDYFIRMWLKLLPHVFTSRTVITDRYVYDTVISDLAVHLNYSQRQMERAVTYGLQLLPHPALTAVLDLPEEVATSRKVDVPHIEYLRERRGLYLRLLARPEVRLFDGAASSQSLLQTLLAEILRLDQKTLSEARR